MFCFHIFFSLPVIGIPGYEYRQQLSVAQDLSPFLPLCAHACLYLFTKYNEAALAAVYLFVVQHLF